MTTTPSPPLVSLHSQSHTMAPPPLHPRPVAPVRAATVVLMRSKSTPTAREMFFGRRDKRCGES